MRLTMDQRNMIARRAAKEIVPGMAVNLGIGIPELVADFIPNEWHVMFHSVNGILGVGPTPIQGEEDQHISNAGERQSQSFRGLPTLTAPSPTA